MKKILGLALAAFMVMGLVGGGTWAYFSDPESSAGSFAAGTLDLTVDGENPWATGAINVGTLAPGDHSGNTTITCTNTGNLEGDLWLRIRNVATDEGDTSVLRASSEPEAVAEGYPGAQTPTTDIDTMLALNCEVDSVAGGLNGLTLTTANTTTWEKIKDNWTSGSVVIEIGATLNSTATNDYQGDNCTFDIELYLTQTDDQSALP